jgi:hypothetical protein
VGRRETTVRNWFFRFLKESIEERVESRLCLSFYESHLSVALARYSSLNWDD